MIYGLMGVNRMNSEAYPQVNFAVATVTTIYRGAGAEDIEARITKPLEDEIRKVSGLKDVRSISQTNLSKIVIRVDMDGAIPVETVMNDLQRAIDRVPDLPTDLEETPFFEEIKSEEFPILELAIVGPNNNRQRDIIAENLKDRIEENENVKIARLTGYHEREFSIYLDHEKMQEHHVGVNEVIEKIRRRNLNIPAGAIESLQERSLLKLQGRVQSDEELGRTLIRSNFSGKRIILNDIAMVRDGKRETDIKARYNGEEATLIMVLKKAGADIITTDRSVEGTIERIRRSLGSEHSIISYRREADEVKNRVGVLRNNAFTGLFIVIMILFLFLPRPIALAACVSLPLSLMGTLGMMNSMGLNLNTITILALVIVLGMLVDNSVVISEHFVRLKEEGKALKEAALFSIGRLWQPLMVTSLTTIAAFLPMLLTKGVMGQFIKWIPLIVAISLAFGLGESFFLLPTRLVYLGKYLKSSNQTNRFAWIEEKFEGIIRWCVRRRYSVSLALILLMIFSVFSVFKINRFILFPPEQTKFYFTRVETPVGSTLEATDKALEILSQEIKQVMGGQVLHLAARAGTSKIRPDDPKSSDGKRFGMITITVNEETRNTIPHTHILRELRKIDTSSYAENVSFEAIINGPPVGEDIEVSFKSNNRNHLEAVVYALRDELGRTEGISELRIDDVVDSDEIFIEIDEEKADRLGLDVASIGMGLVASISGIDVTNVTLNNRNVYLHVRAQKSFRDALEDLDELRVSDARGNLIPLGSVAKFEKREGVPRIKHYNFSLSKTLTGRADENVITVLEANRKLQEIFTPYQKIYPNVSIHYGGVAERTEESLTSMRDAFLFSLIGIFALLVFLFKSYIRPFVIITTIPLGLVGFSIVFFLHDKPVGFLALIGLVGLGGIIVNSGIVLISFIDALKREGHLELETLLGRASKRRLRAVVVTTLTTIGGLVPTAYGIGGSDAVLIPITLAMASGLLSGTLLTLVWIPCAYGITEDGISWIKRWS